jgi:2-iminobutanoate/2-iminopropanoate deaminase
MREPISTPSAPKAVGPYSQAIRAQHLVFVSGQIPIDPATGQVVGEDIAAQTHRVMQNVAGILEAAGTSWAHALRTTVFLADIDDFAAMNEVYGRYVIPPPPARSTVEVARLPKGAKIELDVIAGLPD